ncbi:MAG: ankyrin repeat domain-containing protein [Bacteriovoracaceae bacterium]
MENKNLALVVDDQSEYCESFKIMLSNFNCDVDYATDENEASQKIKDNLYDIIFCDIFSSESSTFIKFIENLAHNDNQNKETPLVLVSGIADKDYLSKIKEKETIVYDFLLKPLDIVAILACMLSVNDRLIGKGKTGLNLPKPKAKGNKNTQDKKAMKDLEELSNNESLEELKGLNPEEVVKGDSFESLYEQNKEDASVTQEGGVNALMLCCLKGDKDKIIELLDENRELLETKDDKGRRPIHYAIMGNRKYVLKELLHKEVNLDIPDDSGLFPLSQAILLKKIDFVQMLIDYQCPLNLGKVNPLLLAFKADSKDIFKKLLFAGLKPEPIMRKIIKDEEFLRILNKF